MIVHDGLNTDMKFLPHEQGGGMYSQVLVPLDGSEASERALPHAHNLADAFSARVHLLQVIPLSHEYEAYLGGGEESPMVSEYSIDMAEQITATAQTKAEAYLKATAARLEAHGIHVQTSVRQGSTLENITNFVEENGIDLIVMSTHGRSGLQRFLIGSVTDRVIRFSHVPVLAIPPEE
jgi:nucleotide-binding universal stress UspA family protein